METCNLFWFSQGGNIVTKNIVIVGAGYAGIAAARLLGKTFKRIKM